MDIGTHLATGLLASTLVEHPTAKALCVLGSVIPDMAQVPYYLYRICKKDWKLWRHMKKDGPDAYHPSWERKIYYLLHSFVFLGFLYGLSFLLKNPLILGFAIGYTTHILLDIPTHKGEAANRPFYPFATFHIDGYMDWWKHALCRKLIVVFWIFLFSAYFLIIS